MDGEKLKCSRKKNEISGSIHIVVAWGWGVAASRSRQGTQLAPRLLEGPQAAAQRRQLRNEAVLPQATTGRTKPSLQVCWWVEEKFYLAQG